MPDTQDSRIRLLLGEKPWHSCPFYGLHYFPPTKTFLEFRVDSCRCAVLSAFLGIRKECVMEQDGHIPSWEKCTKCNRDNNEEMLEDLLANARIILKSFMFPRGTPWSTFGVEFSCWFDRVTGKETFDT